MSFKWNSNFGGNDTFKTNPNGSKTTLPKGTTFTWGSSNDTSTTNKNTTNTAAKANTNTAPPNSGSFATAFGSTNVGKKDDKKPPFQWGPSWGSWGASNANNSNKPSDDKNINNNNNNTASSLFGTVSNNNNTAFTNKNTTSNMFAAAVNNWALNRTTDATNNNNTKTHHNPFLRTAAITQQNRSKHSEPSEPLFLRKINDLENRLRALESKLNDEQRSRLLMKQEMKVMKHQMKKLSTNNRRGPEQRKLKMWLESNVRLPHYYDVFIENGIDDLSTAALLTMETIKGMGIDKIGHQMKILNAVIKLKQNEGS